LPGRRGSGGDGGEEIKDKWFQVSGVRKKAHSSQLMADAKQLECFEAGKLEGLTIFFLFASK
jgi:hypothetical protein